MADFSKLLPPLLVGKELSDSLSCLPEYSSDFRSLSSSDRLMKLTDLYRVFVPTTMSTEIYHKLYMMTSMSLRQKGNVSSILQLNATYKWSHGGEFHGVATGATSATIIGNSGIGKTSCIQYAVEKLGGIIEVDNPYHKVIPVLMVSCPFDASYKGLLCQILISIDEALDTAFYEKVGKGKMNSQQVLGLVCQLCHLYVGTLIVDEIQFVIEHKSGKQLYMMILQLINTSCINVLLVGTNECIDFFKQAPQMARRSVGLQYGPMEHDDEFRRVCQTLFRYQYIKNEAVLTEGMMNWLYEHSAGVLSSLVSLLHDAQEMAILKGRETLGIESLTDAYNNRMKMLHGYIAPAKITSTLPKTTQIKEMDEAILPSPSEKLAYIAATEKIAEIVAVAVRDREDVVKALQKYVTVVEL